MGFRSPGPQGKLDMTELTFPQDTLPGSRGPLLFSTLGELLSLTQLWPLCRKCSIHYAHCFSRHASTVRPRKWNWRACVLSGENASSALGGKKHVSHSPLPSSCLCIELNIKQFPVEESNKPGPKSSSCFSWSFPMPTQWWGPDVWLFKILTCKTLCSKTWERLFFSCFRKTYNMNYRMRRPFWTCF